jgi:hypothetical protein
MEITNLELKFGVLNREVSSWQRCPLREVPLYLKDPLGSFEELGESPEFTILAEVRITGPQWHPTTVIHISDTHK